MTTDLIRRRHERDLARIDFAGFTAFAVLAWFVAAWFIATIFLFQPDPVLIGFLVVLASLAGGGAVKLTSRAVHHYRNSKPTEADRNQERWDQAKQALARKREWQDKLHTKWDVEYSRTLGAAEHYRQLTTKADGSPRYTRIDEEKPTTILRTRITADGETETFRSWRQQDPHPWDRRWNPPYRTEDL